ncbi:Phosphoesterase, RecJ-like protein [Kalmanozyma brasiliensis GHG001]|uniref:Exopolyphosphatase n=1 Tax=Kalmanozyma brasiliensis (strain GHG001) TaxID=1365824 RepID=V5F3K6_KALBG|nr:Phosphoesterase, RecJ-like protein [Kalmanozyma brasiliensis GHG001]EST10104.1 Phosphoesterase, RecJ-like protein [Kalmanozyma brasiliensis GHG001]
MVSFLSSIRQATALLGLCAVVVHGRALPLISEAVFAVQDAASQSTFSLATSPPADAAYSASLTSFVSGLARPLDYWTAEEGVGHLSEWSKATKHSFLSDYHAGRAHEWTIVMGNEGGDLDSLTAALTWAYHLSHSTSSKAIALLQTPLDALDLRPENKLALDSAKMSSGHRDLLTIDELPAHPRALAKEIQGIVLVDHPLPLSRWEGAKVLGIIDHHSDRGVAPDADPRVFEPVASCTTLVARLMLDELEAIPNPPGEYHVPHELLELVLSAIAIDSDGLNPKKSTSVDADVAQRVLDRSNWHDRSLGEVMDRLDKDLGEAKRDLSHLSIRDLLRRDWKGDVVATLDPATPDIHLGFASTPVSLDDQIARTPERTLKAWFKVERRWTAEIHADVSLCLNKFKDRKGNKVREIVLTVREDHRVNATQADSLFREISRALEERFPLKKRNLRNEGKGRQMVWTHGEKSAGRKVVRPIVERAVKNWVSP